ncbi:MAG: tryptophan synthase subunit alpha [Acidobacteria bacterium]|nr:tryptophan synthase subunit alpha [Acidobacteriota bacterium]
MTSLEKRLREIRASGRKALVPYFVAGLTPDWITHVEAAVLAGADAVEIGIPFSDPMMDGVVIQEAAMRALDAGTNLDSISMDLSALSVSVPLIAMTYYNIFHHYGVERAAGKLQASGISGAIVPDLPIEEGGEWFSACAAHDVATILLVAPSTPQGRVETITTACQGFCYATARMAVTGRSSDGGDGARVVDRIRASSDIPAYIGIGVTTPSQAHDASVAGDGVIVGSVLVQAILDGASAPDIEHIVRQFRLAID